MNNFNRINWFSSAGRDELNRMFAILKKLLELIRRMEEIKDKIKFGRYSNYQISGKKNNELNWEWLNHHPTPIGKQRAYSVHLFWRVILTGRPPHINLSENLRNYIATYVDLTW